MSVAEIASTDKQINLKLEIQTSKMVDNCFRLDILECELVLLSKLFIFRRDLLGEKKAIQDMNICIPKCPDQDVSHGGCKVQGNVTSTVQVQGDVTSTDPGGCK